MALDWQEAYARWSNRRRDRYLADVASWRLLQELQMRGDLIRAEEADLGLSKGGTGKLRIGAHPVDRNGLPLFRLSNDAVGADDEMPDIGRGGSDGD